MYILKGFFLYPSLVSNVPDKVAVLGEISSDSLTYAKDKTYYTSIDTPSTSFISFHSRLNDTIADVSADTRNVVLRLSQFLYDQSVAGTITDNATVLRQLVTAEFNGLITNFNTGRMLTDQNLWLPEWIEFELVNGEPNRVNIWLSDESFSGQYDEYFIEIIHPILPFDDFFKDPVLVKELLDSYNIVEKLEEAQEKRGVYPYTFQRAFVFDYVHPRDPSIRWPTTWIAEIYGIDGNNPDRIVDKITDELLKDSNHTREDWETILPDLFLRTEFIFTPFWNNYSVEASDFRAGIYSPIVIPKKASKLMEKTTKGPNYTPTYINNNLEYGSNIYKSIAFGVVGNPKNRLGQTSFYKRYPDYFLVTNESGDINRAEPETVEWMLNFSKLLKSAETMSRYSTVPRGISRMVRDNVVYASMYFKNINYLVVSKQSVEDLG